MVANAKKTAKTRGPITSSQRLLDAHDVEDFTRLSRDTIMSMVEAGEFPKPFPVRTEAQRQSLRWTLGSVEAWVRRRVAQQEGAAA